MKKITYAYIFVPLVLSAFFLAMLIFNNEIIGYLPPTILSIYPLYPCWPPNDGFDTGGIPAGGRDIHFFNNYMIYHVCQPIDPGIGYTSEDFGIESPDLYIYHGNQTEMRMVMAYFEEDSRIPSQEVSFVSDHLNGLTVWHQKGHVLKSGPRCRILAQYSVDQLAQPPRLNSTGVYVFHADFGAWRSKGASYDFYVTNP